MNRKSCYESSPAAELKCRRTPLRGSTPVTGVSSSIELPPVAIDENACPLDIGRTPATATTTLGKFAAVLRGSDPPHASIQFAVVSPLSTTGGSFLSEETAPQQQTIKKQQQLRTSSCQCPCRACAACPVRAEQQLPTDPSESSTSTSELLTGRLGDWICAPFLRLARWRAADVPGRYRFDCLKIPEEPLKRPQQRLLEITEFPFLILWVYGTYWICIVAIAAKDTPSTVWISAAVASVLVGIGLNANAYKCVTVPRRRGTIRHHRCARALFDLHRYGGDYGDVEMKIDWGTVIRFFVIPFGVSALSGITNANRHRFLLVFPKDTNLLMLAILIPASIVTFMAMLRIYLLWRLKVRWSTYVLFLNGALVD